MDYPSNVSNQMPMPGEPKEGGVGAVIGIIVIVLVLVVGGWYFYSTKQQDLMNKEQNKMMENSEQSGETSESLEAELGMDADIDAGLNEIDKDF